MSDPWKDPNVKQALSDGRAPDDIALLRCPRCRATGYYNEGIWFSCLSCGVTFYVLGEDEEKPDDIGNPCLAVTDAQKLSDYT